MVNVECRKRVDEIIGIYLAVLFLFVILFVDTPIMLILVYGIIAFFYKTEKEGKLTKDIMLNILADSSLFARAAFLFVLYLFIVFSPILMLTGLVVVYSGGAESPFSPLLIFFSQFFNFSFFTYFIPKTVNVSSFKEILINYFWFLNGVFVNEDKTAKQNAVVSLICALAYLVYPPATVVISFLYLYFLFVCGTKGIKKEVWD